MAGTPSADRRRGWQGTPVQGYPNKPEVGKAAVWGALFLARPRTRIGNLVSVQNMWEAEMQQPAMTEKDLLRCIRNAAKDCGWLCYHTWTSIHSPRGLPDLLMVRNGKLLFWELKSATGKLTDKQKEWLNALAQVPGADVRVVRPSNLEEAYQILVGGVDLGAVVRRDQGRCGICHKRVAPSDKSFDHIIPLSKGGMHNEANLQLSHKRCNSRRGAGCLPAQMRLELQIG